MTEELTTTENAVELYQEREVHTPVLNKASSGEMTMAEFGEWVENNLGTSVQQALEQAAFMLCCDVISQDIAKATLRLRRRTGARTSEIIEPKQHPIARMLALQPNKRHTWHSYVEMTMYWLCLSSNSFAGVLRNRTNDPVELIPFQTGKVQEKVHGRDVFYDVTAGTLQEAALLGSYSRIFPERDMIHVRSRMIDGMDGYSTLSAGKKTLDVGKAIDKYRGTLFNEDGALRGVFTRKDAEPMTDDAFARFRQQLSILMNKFRKLTEPIVLEGDFDFKSISSNPTEVELTKQFAAQINATCRLLRVPPHKVFQMDGVKYENLETSEKMYVGDTLIPRCKGYEEQMARVLLTEDERLEMFFEFDREELELRDPARETERVIKTAERGLILVDEARAKLGYNPLPNGQGQVRLVPTNMSLVDIDGEVVVAGSSTSKPDSDPENKPADEPEADKEKDAQLLRLVADNAR